MKTICSGKRYHLKGTKRYIVKYNIHIRIYTSVYIYIPTYTHIHTHVYTPYEENDTRNHYARNIM